MGSSVVDPHIDEIVGLYKLHTTQEIADMFGVCAEVIRRALKGAGVEMRRRGAKRQFNPGKAELEALYQQYSMKQIARLYHVGETVVWKRLREHGIKLRDYEDGGHRKKPGRKFSRAHRENLSKAFRGRWAGENNPHWRGGVHQENLRARASGEYRQWRLAALELRGNKCQECGIANGSWCECCGTRIKLHVHHVLGFAKHKDRRYDPENSEVLCPKCHHSRHHGKPGELRGTPNG